MRERGSEGEFACVHFVSIEGRMCMFLKARAPTNASVILTDSLVMLSYTVICNGCCWDYISFIYDIVYFLYIFYSKS